MKTVNPISKITLAAGFALAMAFTLQSCGATDDTPELPVICQDGFSWDATKFACTASSTGGQCPQGTTLSEDGTYCIAPPVDTNPSSSSEDIVLPSSSSEDEVPSSSSVAAGSSSSSSLVYGSSSSSVNVIERECGEESYNPETEFCFFKDNKVYPLCRGKEYAPDASVSCSNGNLVFEYGSLVYDKTYKTIKIGDQTWMAENLAYDAPGSVCYANYCPTNNRRFYNWDAAMEVCPDGWHLPSSEEWDILARFVDGSDDVSSPYDSYTADIYLRETNWKLDGEVPGLDAYGFTAQPDGFAFLLEDFGYDGIGYAFDRIGVGGAALWWTSSYQGITIEGPFVYYCGLDTGYYSCSSVNAKLFLSVRCVQD